MLGDLVVRSAWGCFSPSAASLELLWSQADGTKCRRRPTTDEEKATPFLTLSSLGWGGRVLKMGGGCGEAV